MSAAHPEYRDAASLESQASAVQAPELRRTIADVQAGAGVAPATCETVAQTGSDTPQLSSSADRWPAAEPAMAAATQNTSGMQFSGIPGPGGGFNGPFLPNGFMDALLPAMEQMAMYGRNLGMPHFGAAAPFLNGYARVGGQLAQAASMLPQGQMPGASTGLRTSSDALQAPTSTAGMPGLLNSASETVAGPGQPAAGAPTVSQAQAATPQSLFSAEQRTEIKRIVQDVALELFSTNGAGRAMFEQLAMEFLESPGAIQMIQEALARDEARTETPARTRRPRIPSELTRAVHRVMRALIGCEVKKASDDPRIKPYYDLPGPLRPEDSPRHAPDGSLLHNPDWLAPIDEGVNADYIAAVITLVQQNGVSEFHLQPEHAQDNDLVRRAARTYFRQLRRQYKYRLDEAGKKKLAKKNFSDKLASRRQRKADFRRKGVRGFRRAFGKSRTKGLRRLIHSPWQSDQCSDDGKGGERARQREERRKAQDAGKNALETVPQLWRSRQLTILYIVLGVFARYRELYEADESDSDASALASDDESDSESELSEGERQEYLMRVLHALQGGQLTATNPQRHESFHGSPDHGRAAPRKRKGVTLYKECFSKSWRAKYPQHAHLYEKAKPAPSTWTVLTLDVPETLLPAEEHEHGWLGDTEDEAEDQPEAE
ncbi:hypothetical protein BV20DRAFT_1056780 [Pilatotrama ljubarskyi]|nr:hypothetical protein BV20DRAFT_1056780 [Pilatotrama ljubarskyi]